MGVFSIEKPCPIRRLDWSLPASVDVIIKPAVPEPRSQPSLGPVCAAKILLKVCEKQEEQRNKLSNIDLIFIIAIYYHEIVDLVKN